MNPKHVVFGLALAAAVVGGVAVAAKPGKKGKAGEAVAVEQVGTLRHAPLGESSGLAASRRNAGVYWTHCDANNPAVVYAVRADGTLLAEFPVAAKNTDWEAVAVDADGKLYIGNIGNNQGKRKWLEVLRLTEPAVDAGAINVKGAELKPDKVWRLKYPDAPFDAESLFVHGGEKGGHGYVISKAERKGETAWVYRFALDGPADAIVEKWCELPVRAPVTDADLSADGKSLAVLASDGLHVIALDKQVRPTADAPRVLRVPKGQLEGVCITADGFLITAESREVYRVRP